MINEYEMYHGQVLRNIICSVGLAVRIEDCDEQGRKNSFLINDKVSIYIKHSRKRLTPWIFTFHKGHLVELERLAIYDNCFVVLVCGTDGNLALTIDEIVQLFNGCSSSSAFLRVVRHRNTMYEIFGPDGCLKRRVPRGLKRITQEIA